MTPMTYCIGFVEHVSIDSGQKEMRIFFLILKKDRKHQHHISQEKLKKRMFNKNGFDSMLA